MSIDYSPFLSADKDGRIWWLLEDAIKLGAGYVPERTEDCEPARTLIPAHDGVDANEEIMRAAFHDSQFADLRPKVVERKNGLYVDARHFLGWLSQYITRAQADIPFPDDLVRAVRDGPCPEVDNPLVKSSFESLTVALEGWFDHPLSELPDAVLQRVEKDFSPMPWDILTSDQRRSVAHQWDYHHDPAAERDRTFWWDFFVRQQEIEGKIEECRAADAPTVTDLANKESRLADLEKRLDRMKQHEQRARGDYYPEAKHPDAPPVESLVKYVAYPSAMKMLALRLGATPEEVAAWVWMGPNDGGLAAFVNANQLKPPPRFFFHYYLNNENDWDYLSPLMSCWFREEDVLNFQPADRYITGKALIERWSARPHIKPEAFIRAKIAESRLAAPPIYGGTRAMIPDPSSPPIESGLFAMAHVEAIEREDFAKDDERSHPLAKSGAHSKPDTGNWKMLVQAEAARRWISLRKAWANPTKFSITDDLASWCRENGIRTITGINPSAEYIYRHALRDWNPPNG